MSLPRLQSAPINIKNRFLPPSALFLILALLVGILYCIFIPYGAGFDEETHMVRIMDISGLNMLPNHSKQDKTISFKEFFDLSYQRRYFQSPAFDLFAPDKINKKLDIHNPFPIQTRSVYSPVIFFPQALVAKISWGLLDLPVIPGVILQRITGLFVYILGAYFAIRWLPFGKWVFTALALSPMALFQASTLNADGFTNAFCFLFIGLTLKIYADRDQTIRPWQVWALFALAVMVGLAKPGYFPLLLLALILPLRCFQSKKLAIVLAAGVLLAVFLTFGWTALAVPKSHFSDGGSQSLSRQLSVILAQPLDFAILYFQGIFHSAGSFFRDWVGVYGYWVGEVPGPVYFFYPLVILAALVLEPKITWLTWKIRVFIIGLALASTGFIILLYYYLHYTPGELSDLGRQGRYFIPTLPLFFIALSGLISVQSWAAKVFRGLALGCLLVALGFYSFGLYAAYYTECGYGIYAGRSCVLPVYKNLEKASAPEVIVNTQSMVSQKFTSDCGSVEAVQILVKSIPAGAAGTLRYSLLDQGGHLLAAKDIPLSQIPLDTYFSLPVTPPARNAAYEIRLESPDIAASRGIGIATRPGDLYQNGVLAVAGAAQDADMIFHYVCPNPLANAH